VSALPTPIDPAAATRFGRESKSFVEKAAKLQSLTVSEFNAALANEFDTEARNWWTAAEAQRVYLKAPKLEDIRRHDKFWGEMMASALVVRKEARRLIVGWERERQAKLAQRQRADEAGQLAEQTRNQKAEVDHLLTIAATSNDQGALQAAIDKENEPPVPVVSSVDPDAGKVAGTSVTLRKAGIIADPAAFFKENAWSILADMIDLKTDVNEAGPVLRIMPSALDDKLNRGLALKGVQVFKKDITRNVSRG